MSNKTPEDPHPKPPVLTPEIRKKISDGLKHRIQTDLTHAVAPYATILQQTPANDNATPQDS